MEAGVLYQIWVLIRREWAWICWIENFLYAANSPMFYLEPVSAVNRSRQLGKMRFRLKSGVVRIAQTFLEGDARVANMNAGLADGAPAVAIHQDAGGGVAACFRAIMKAVEQRGMRRVFRCHYPGEGSKAELRDILRVER